jgi:hypothetical protein
VNALRSGCVACLPLLSYAGDEPAQRLATPSKLNLLHLPHEIGL